MVEGRRHVTISLAEDGVAKLYSNQEGQLLRHFLLSYPGIPTYQSISLADEFESFIDFPEQTLTLRH